jgi:hypothetical protein
MQKNYFSLETVENSRLTRIFQVILGIACTGISVFWMFFNMQPEKENGTSWITIIFLAAFGLYMIFAGLGKTVKFIETGPEKIRFKKNSLLPVTEINPADIKRIESFPLNVVFFTKRGSKIIFRMGMTYPELIETIKSEIAEFAAVNNIPLEVMKEEI